MDFSFDINKLLREEITTVDSRLQPCRQHGIDRYGFQQLQRMLYEVIDKMGDASAKAQGLHGSITTGKKLEHTNHHVYIMKDSSGNNGQGCVVGILKMGHKKLFVYDNCKAQHEMDPMCVLDFYVHESRQRMGCGRKLFDFMLSREGIPAEHLAVDRPSPKFLSFLKKHYNLKTIIPQVNNFVIFEHFFSNRSNSRGKAGGRSMVPGVFSDRASPMRPASDHRLGDASSTDLGYHQTSVYGSRRQQSHSAERSWTPSMARQSPSHMGAGDMMYSRHRATPPSNGRATPTQGLNRRAATPTRNVYPQQVQPQQQNQPLLNQYQKEQQLYQQNQQQPYRQHQQQPAAKTILNNYYDSGHNDSASFYKQLNSFSSPSTYYNTGTAPSSYGKDGRGGGGNNILEHLPPKPPMQNLRQTGASPASTPNFGNRAGGGGGRSDVSSAYPSLHPSQAQGFAGGLATGSTPPPPPNAAPSPSLYPSNSASALPPVADAHPNQQTQLTQIQLNQQENLAHRPPSGKQTYPNNRRGGSQPPMLQRDGPPSNYKDMLNMHQGYQGRNGRLNVPNDAMGIPGSPYGKTESHNNTWTVSGVLREQRLNAPLSNRYYNSTRLW